MRLPQAIKGMYAHMIVRSIEVEHLGKQGDLIGVEGEAPYPHRQVR